MLRKDFLRKVFDYVSRTIAETDGGRFAHEELLYFLNDKEEKFSLNTDLTILGLFSEWLVFDRKQKIFGGLTGLQYFLQKEKLSEIDFKEYQDLVVFDVGLFEVEEITPGLGMVLHSLQTDSVVFVNDINSSLSLIKGETLWARISEISSLYYIVSSMVFAVPIKALPSLKKKILEEKKNSFDAKRIAELSKSGDISESEMKNKFTTYEKAKADFSKVLKDASMDTIFSVEIFESWVVNEKKYGKGFATKAILGLMPSEISKHNFEMVANSAMIFSNTIPRKFLKGKSPNDVFFDKDKEKNEQKIFDVDYISKEKYLTMLENAHALMGKNDFKGSYKIFADTIKELLKDRMPLFDCFRIYCNAAIVCFHIDKPGLGEELLLAAIRINPKYKFAYSVKDDYVFGDIDFSKVPKKDRSIVKDMRELIKYDGERAYKRSPFFKYEVFLKKIQISLEYEAQSKATVYSDSGKGEVKIGRNEPCYCGSGKKYKKCHGNV